jgi:dTDP-glucose 4,6-dehydratase
VTFVYADVASGTPALQSILTRAGVTKVSTIYHLASPASRTACEARPLETLAVNATGTISLIEIARQHGARFVYASSSDVYRNDGPASRSVYAEAKRFGEAAVSAAMRARVCDARVVRLFECFGPRVSQTDARFVAVLLDAITHRRPFPIGMGQRTRSMTYVADVVDVLIRCADSRDASSAVSVDIGSDDVRTEAEIAMALATIAGVEFSVDLNAPDNQDNSDAGTPDLTIAASFGWRPTTSLESGLRATYDWYIKDSQIFV